MDGNGRWAEQRNLPRWRGHEAAVGAVRRTMDAACRNGIPVLTLFAFSSENWKRPPSEIEILFRLFVRYLADESESLIENHIRLSVFGRRDRLSPNVIAGLEKVEAVTYGGSRLHLRLGIDYGSRHELVEAAQALARKVAAGELSVGQIDEALFADTLSSCGIPDPDLIIRTAGEQRLSNFLLWQAAYAEFHFCPRLWPDFDEGDFQHALHDYHSRTRKFGALPALVGV
jgi:undecaprenyl diphosphate synthase